MDSLLHPAGPEPERTYWIRRAIVLGVLVLVLILVIWGISGLFGEKQDSTDAGPVVVSTTPAVMPSQETDSSATPSTSAMSIPSSPAPSDASSSTPVLSTSVMTASAPAAKAPASSAAPSSTPAPKPTGPVACDPTKVAPGIEGATRVNTGRSVNLRIGLTTTTTCVLDFDATPFELRIYSGSDRIWSTNDCSTFKPSGTTTLKPGTAWAYVVTWDTKRSLGECKVSDGYLQPGTYVATAVLSGGTPTQHVMTVLA